MQDLATVVEKLVHARRALARFEQTKRDVVEVSWRHILALAAVKKKIKNIIALDIDQESIIACQKNAYLNSVSFVSKQETLEQYLEKAEDKVTFDLILANILLPVLLSHISLISSVCREGSRVILSGILESQVEEMLESCNKVSLSLVSQSLKKDWACLELVKV